jgi:hypothetical protein
MNFQKRLTHLIQKAFSILPVTILALSACNLPFPTSTFTPIPPLVSASETYTSLPATETSIPPTLTPIPTSLQPTASSQPTLTTVPGATYLNFASGATSGFVTGLIQPGQVIGYLVGAGKGQPMLISTDSLNNDVTFSVVGLSDGKVLLSASDKLSSWETMLTVSQLYLVQVIAGATSENYTLNVSSPARVTFAPSATFATLTGTTPGGLTVAYAVYALKDQQMNLNLTVPGGNAVLSVYGYEDGNPYLRYVVEQTTFSLKLPASQDYIIQVVPRAGEVASYTLTITIK